VQGATHLAGGNLCSPRGVFGKALSLDSFGPRRSVLGALGPSESSEEEGFEEGEEGRRKRRGGGGLGGEGREASGWRERGRGRGRETKVWVLCP